MMYLLVAFIWLLNFAISCWNSYAVGKAWPYAKLMGGWVRLVVWSGYLMAVAGFSWCFLIPLALLAYVNGWYGFDLHALKACLDLGYLIIAPVILFAGVFIWVDSLIEAWRRRTLGSIATAGWNTFAQISNTIDVLENYVPAFNNVWSFFSSCFSNNDDGKDEDGNTATAKLAMLVIALVAASLVAGFLLATAIVFTTARKEAREFAREAKAAR
jgi:hypothetical protein